MEIKSIECHLDDEESWEGQVSCPACNEIWIDVRDGGGTVATTNCCHLRFVIEPESDQILCFNGFQVRDLADAIRPLIQGQKGGGGISIGEPTDEALTEFLIKNRFDDAMWAAIHSTAADTLFDYTESGMACGPVSMTEHIGARMRG